MVVSRAVLYDRDSKFGRGCYFSTNLADSSFGVEDWLLLVNLSTSVSTVCHTRLPNGTVVHHTACLTSWDLAPMLLDEEATILDVVVKLRVVDSSVRRLSIVVGCLVYSGVYTFIRGAISEEGL